ncbi:hypothetical protein B566_EDAN011459 [Ephemera danica]|nr:hypothetical protein B566_EDAN011459 [Ephemera danica]
MLISLVYSCIEVKWYVPQPMTCAVFDSSTKIPDGLLYGNIVQLGNFDECLEVTPPDGAFTGRWCRVVLTNVTLLQRENTVQDTLSARDLMLLPLKYALIDSASTTSSAYGEGSRMGVVPPLPVQWAVCAPSSCVDEGVQFVTQLNLAQFGLVASSDVLSKTCFHYDDPEYDFTAASWCWIALLVLLVGVAVASTLYECYVVLPSGEPPRHLAIVAFSLRLNLCELFHVPRRAALGTLSCLHGIRVLSMAWVVLGHRYYIQFYMPNINVVDLFDFPTHWNNMVIVNAFLAVETFFLLSGLLASYVACCGVLQGRTFNLLQYYVYRYVRLTLPLAFYIFFVAAMSDRITHGPMWDSTVIPEANGCRARWWTTILYVNNWADSKICGGQTWYLSVDMQLSWLAPLLLLPLLRWPKPTLGVIAFLTLASASATFAVTYIFELTWTNPLTLDPQKAIDYWQHVYRWTPLRAVPYLCGLALGWLLSRPGHSWREKMPRWGWWFGWLTSTGLCLTVVFTLVIPYSEGHEYSVVQASFYGSLHRVAWALGVSWVILACVACHGGPVNRVLSWRGFVPLSKLTYCAYLTHYIVIFMSGGLWRNPHHFSNISAVHTFLGDLFMIFLPTLVLYVLVEAPVVTLLRSLFGKGTPGLQTARDHDKKTDSSSEQSRH